MDEQNAQTQQHVFSVGRSEQQVGLVEEEEEEDGEEDKLSLQSSFSSKQRSGRRREDRQLRTGEARSGQPEAQLFVSLLSVSKTPCEKLIHKGSLLPGSSASLPVHTGNRDNMPMLNTKILYPGKMLSHVLHLNEFL